MVVGIAGVFEGVAQGRHEFGGFEVDGGFFGEGVLAVAGDEGEVLDVAVEFPEREIGDEALAGFEVVELEAGEVGDGAGLDLCPTQRHGSKNSRGSGF